MTEGIHDPSDAFFQAAEKLGRPRYRVDSWLHTGYDDPAPEEDYEVKS